VQHTVRYAGRNLLEDEVFSCVILQLDPHAQTVRIASCGMPPLLLVRDGVPERVRGNNPPLTAFTEQVRIQELSLDGVSDLLLATDGLGDAPMKGGGAYCGRLPDDLAGSGTARDLFDLFQGFCDPDDDDDDVTLIRLMKAAGTAGAPCRRFAAPGTVSGVAGLQRQVREHLEAAGLAGERLERLDLALGEALMNAFEHGCLRMGTDKKRLLLAGEYDDLIMTARPRPGEEISAAVSVVQRQGRVQVWAEVADPGPGMDERRATQGECRTAPSGRGYALMKRSVDLVRRNPAGNRILLMQMFTREDV
jgi:anti-sigma regulatory factor (Ser/Thr protein kinase)